jgi:hypothetical protein
MTYYTYIWYRTDKEIPEPFYVGKGKDNRFEGYHSKHFQNIMKVHNKLGIKPKVEFYYKGKSEITAYRNEIMLIEKFGRKCLGTGPLINLTPGGEGGCPSGEKHWNWGKKASPELRKKLSDAHKGYKHTEAQKRKISISVSEAKAQNWLIIYPNGKEKEINNLTKFCKSNNLNHSHMISVNQGKRKHHKGFKCHKLEAITCQ